MTHKAHKIHLTPEEELKAAHHEEAFRIALGVLSDSTGNRVLDEQDSAARIMMELDLSKEHNHKALDCIEANKRAREALGVYADLLRQSLRVRHVMHPLPAEPKYMDDLVMKHMDKLRDTLRDIESVGRPACPECVKEDMETPSDVVFQ